MKLANAVFVILGGGLLLWLCAYPWKAGAISPSVKMALSEDIIQAPTISTNSTAQDVQDFAQYFKRRGYVVHKSDAVYGPGGTLQSFDFRAAYPGAQATVETMVQQTRRGIGIFTREGSITSIGISECKTPLSRMLKRIGRSVNHFV